VQALGAAVLAALLGLAVGHALLKMPQMLGAQAVADAMGAGFRRLGTLAVLYVPLVLVYGALVLTLTRAVRWRSVWAFLALGMLPLAGYAMYFVTNPNAPAGWLREVLFHLVPVLLASVALWAGAAQE